MSLLSFIASKNLLKKNKKSTNMLYHTLKLELIRSEYHTLTNKFNINKTYQQ